MIEQLIRSVAKKLGVSDALAEQGAGVALALLDKLDDSPAVKALLDKIPGASALAQKHASALDVGAGGGGLAGMVGGLMGGDGGLIMKALGALQGAGFSTEQAKELPGVIGGFLREHGDAAALDQILAKTKGLKELF